MTAAPAPGRAAVRAASLATHGRTTTHHARSRSRASQLFTIRPGSPSCSVTCRGDRVPRGLDRSLHRLHARHGLARIGPEEARRLVEPAEVANLTLGRQLLVRGSEHPGEPLVDALRATAPPAALHRRPTRGPKASSSARSHTTLVRRAFRYEWHSAGAAPIASEATGGSVSKFSYEGKRVVVMRGRCLDVAPRSSLAEMAPSPRARLKEHPSRHDLPLADLGPVCGAPRSSNRAHLTLCQLRCPGRCSRLDVSVTSPSASVTSPRWSLRTDDGGAIVELSSTAVNETATREMASLVRPLLRVAKEWPSAPGGDRRGTTSSGSHNLTMHAAPTSRAEHPLDCLAPDRLPSAYAGVRDMAGRR